MAQSRFIEPIQQLQSVIDARLRFCRINSMNVCNDGSSILVFKEPPDSNLASGIGAGAADDPGWLDHCRSREFAERAAAKRATCSRAREIHQELAQFYGRLAEKKDAK